MTWRCRKQEVPSTKQKFRCSKMCSWNLPELNLECEYETLSDIGFMRWRSIKLSLSVLSSSCHVLLNYLLQFLLTWQHVCMASWSAPKYMRELLWCVYSANASSNDCMNSLWRISPGMTLCHAIEADSSFVCRILLEFRESDLRSWRDISIRHDT